jgi:tRNA pseudouridine synthase 10
VSRTGQQYRLCQWCAQRQGGGFEEVEGRSCFVCGGFMDGLPSMARRAVAKVRMYDFGTFTVGVSLPEGVQEREDELRSDLKLKGNETAKTQAARLVADEVAVRLRKRIDRLRPDLTFLVDIGDGEVMVSSKPVYYYGRYTKPSGVSQRREFCGHCSGTGCKRCGQTGFDRKPSVEAQLRRKLGVFTGSERMTFTWLGSEDRESRVFAPGRPFIAEVKNPVKRRVPGRFVARFTGGQVSVSSGRVLGSKPVRLPSFRFRTEIIATASKKVPPENLAELRARFRKTVVRFERPHDRPVSKNVYRAAATAKGRTLVIDAELDGGLPVRRFVSGDLVSPSVSEVLKTEVRCRTFDICQVRETGKLELAEITRVQKEN